MRGIARVNQICVSLFYPPKGKATIFFQSDYESKIWIELYDFQKTYLECADSVAYHGFIHILGINCDYDLLF